MWLYCLLAWMIRSVNYSWGWYECKGICFKKWARADDTKVLHCHCCVCSEFWLLCDFCCVPYKGHQRDCWDMSCIYVSTSALRVVTPTHMAAWPYDARLERLKHPLSKIRLFTLHWNKEKQWRCLSSISGEETFSGLTPLRNGGGSELTGGLGLSQDLALRRDTAGRAGAKARKRWTRESRVMLRSEGKSAKLRLAAGRPDTCLTIALISASLWLIW